MDQKKAKLHDAINTLHNNSSDYCTMKQYLINMFQCIPNVEGKNNY